MNAIKTHTKSLGFIATSVVGLCVASATVKRSARLTLTRDDDVSSGKKVLRCFCFNCFLKNIYISVSKFVLCVCMRAYIVCGMRCVFSGCLLFATTQDAVPVINNKKFRKQILKLIRIVLPSWYCREAGILCVHTLLLFARTFL